MSIRRTLRFLTIASFLTLSATALVGCSSAVSSEGDAQEHGHDHDHDHGSRPDSLHDAVHQLEEVEQKVSAAIDAGDPEAAHDPLHEVAELLEVLPDVAAETDLPKQEWEAVKAASVRLFDAYAVIDKAFHVKDGDKKAAYDEVASELSEALEEIRSRLPLTGESADEHDHDEHHDEHHDDDHDHDHDGDA